MRPYLLLILFMLMAGCVPYSEHPLTPPDNGSIDAELLGTWFWKEKDESGYIHVGLEQKTRLLRVLMVAFNRNNELDESEFSGHTSFLSGNRYLNLKWVRPGADAANGYMLIRYRVEPGRLGIAMMDNVPLEKAIRSGAIAGSVEKEKWASSIRITEGQTKLQSFILGNDSQLFPELKYLKRLDLPLTPES
ncbi:MAG: hypothetical protein V1793_23210 [Pseudomonadota bacterium]